MEILKVSRGDPDRPRTKSTIAISMGGRDQIEVENAKEIKGLAKRAGLGQLAPGIVLFTPRSGV